MYRSYEEYMRNVLNYKSNERANIMEDFDRSTFNRNPFDAETIENRFQYKPSNLKIPKLNITNFNNL